MPDGADHYTAIDRKREIARRQTEVLCRAGGMVLDAKPLNAVFLEVIPLITQITQYDDKVAEYRIRKASITGERQSNPFSKRALNALANAVDESLASLRAMTLKIAPDQAIALRIAEMIAAKSVADLACPTYLDREANFALAMSAALKRQPRATTSHSRRGKPRKRRESDSATKVLAALSQYHLVCGAALRTDALSHASIAANAETSAASVTRFMQQCFGCYEAYVRTCNECPEELWTKLQRHAETRCRGARLKDVLVVDPADAHFMAAGDDEMDADFSSHRNPLPSNALQRECVRQHG